MLQQRKANLRLINVVFKCQLGLGTQTQPFSGKWGDFLNGKKIPQKRI